jgi:hypothetical protein
MSTEELHERYAPIMRFSRDEQFYPVSVEDYLSYAALYHKDEEKPVVPQGQVRPSHLTRRHAEDTYLRTVTQGPAHGLEVARGWGKDTLALVYEWGSSPAGAWSEEVARSVYDWLNEKTKGATKHFWWNSLVFRPTLLPKKPGVRSELPRFRLPQSVRDSALESYEASQGVEPAYAYYYRTVQHDEFLNLQYWFFYAYNDWCTAFDGFNDHEGDWEGLQLFFRLDAGGRPTEPPAYICYLGHHSRITKPWNHPDVEKSGTHPHVYVAAGSHASYPERKPYSVMSLYNLVDYATGDALILSHDRWRRRINLDEVPWVHSYPGSWGTRYWLRLGGIQRILGSITSAVPGEIHLPGVSAPRGPRLDDEGQERETWGRADRFAGISEP